MTIRWTSTKFTKPILQPRSSGSMVMWIPLPFMLLALLGNLRTTSVCGMSQFELIARALMYIRVLVLRYVWELQEVGRSLSRQDWVIVIVLRFSLTIAHNHPSTLQTSTIINYLTSTSLRIRLVFKVTQLPSALGWEAFNTNNVLFSFLKNDLVLYYRITTLVLCFNLNVGESEPASRICSWPEESELLRFSSSIWTKG